MTKNGPRKSTPSQKTPMNSHKQHIQSNPRNNQHIDIYNMLTTSPESNTSTKK
ncbi:hypothetical protein Leryth_024360 [Lithospermum erythrorhizon]|nr:hypothetical protein Leryth_024360 [Lithospermum erythrorhizon]